MELEIITIGDEILIGQIVDTNSAWMAKQLNALGIGVRHISTVSDVEADIVKAFDIAAARVDIVLITGGLGPTKDDITKHILCNYFNTKLVFNAQALKNIQALFNARGVTEIREINRRQADLPEACTVLYNLIGTASGMWFERDGKIFISMPGVPYEMEALMQQEVLPKLKERFHLPPLLHKTILTHGIAESSLSEMISSWEDKLPENLKLAYLPSAGTVKLRLSGRGDNEQHLQKQMAVEISKVEPLIASYIYGYDEDTLESLVGQLLTAHKKTMVTAESCTGGYLAHRISSIPGASAYFSGALIAYSNEIKIKLLAVPEATIENFGAVSEETAIAMAKGALLKMPADYAISCTGIAGPGGGTLEKPVGTVWIAVATSGKTITKHLLLGTNRERNIQRTAMFAMNLLIKELKAPI
jgi:nicotinamide-nucleotide amidase